MDPAELVMAIEPGALDEWVHARRWFASKARDLLRVEIVDAITVSEREPALVVAIAESVFAAGTHEHYQVPLVIAAPQDADEDAIVARAGDLVVLDALADSRAGLALGRLLGAAETIGAAGGDEGEGAHVSFHHTTPIDLPPADEVVPLTAEQSNTSIVFDETLVLKCYRRLEPGESPELEMLRFLAEHDFTHIPALLGWYSYRGAAMDATLGVAQRFVPGGRDGWELALERLATDPRRLLGELRDLGRVIGELHSVLGSDTQDPDFAPEAKGTENLDLVIATIDEEIRDVFQQLPESDESVAPIIGREAALRERLAATQHLGDLGMAIRAHGDLHLGQALLDDEGRWMIIDFEGEPARSLRERRRRRSPLRDVAALLSSVSYAAAASRRNGANVPASWETEARAGLLEAYLAHVDATLLPAGGDATATLLRLFEIEKSVYELGYELHNRPDWLGIPVAGITRLLEAAPA